MQNDDKKRSYFSFTSLYALPIRRVARGGGGGHMDECPPPSRQLVFFARYYSGIPENVFAALKQMCTFLYKKYSYAPVANNYNSGMSNIKIMLFQQAILDVCFCNRIFNIVYWKSHFYNRRPTGMKY